MRTITLLALALVSLTATAQTKDKGATPPPSDDPYGVAVLMESLDDIRELGVLWKLKLTKEQIPKLIAELQSVEGKINQAQAAEAKSLQSLKEDILKQRAEAVKGKAAPDSFYDRVGKVFKDASKKRGEMRLAEVKASSERIRKILTDTQYKDIIAESRKTLKAIGDSGADKATDNQAYWYFVENALFSPRVTKLLREMEPYAPEPPATDPK